MERLREQSLLFPWRVHLLPDSVGAPARSFLIWPVSVQENVVLELVFQLNSSAVYTHLKTPGQQIPHSQDSGVRGSTERCSGVKGPLTFHTSRNTRASSGMNSREKRLRSTTSGRSLCWSVTRNNPTSVSPQEHIPSEEWIIEKSLRAFHECYWMSITTGVVTMSETHCMTIITWSILVYRDSSRHRVTMYFLFSWKKQWY